MKLRSFHLKISVLVFLLFIFGLLTVLQGKTLFDRLWKMGSGRLDEVPEWAQFFTVPQYQKFIASVKNYFKQQGIDVVIEDGVARAKNNSEESDDLRLGLQNIAQICKQSDEAQWDDIIKEFFDNFI